jgi:hypothetical protein
MSRALILSALISTAFTGQAMAASSLIGSNVSAGVYCCTGPVASDLFTNIASATVGAGVEFPLGSLTSVTPGIFQIPVNIDITSDQILATYTAADTAFSGAFNGYVFTFQGAPVITGVTLNSALTSLGLQSVTLGFTGNSVLVSGAGLSFAQGDTVAVNVAMAPVPEPGSIALASAGLLMLLARKARRAQKN